MGKPPFTRDENVLETRLPRKKSWESPQLESAYLEGALLLAISPASKHKIDASGLLLYVMLSVYSSAMLTPKLWKAANVAFSLALSWHHLVNAIHPEMCVHVLKQNKMRLLLLLLYLFHSRKNAWRIKLECVVVIVQKEGTARPFSAPSTAALWSPSLATRSHQPRRFFC